MQLSIIIILAHLVYLQSEAKAVWTIIILQLSEILRNINFYIIFCLLMFYYIAKLSIYLKYTIKITSIAEIIESHKW